MPFIRLCKMACAGLTCLIFSCAVDTSNAQDLGALDAALKAAGYRMYNPPRSNWGPGFVFYGDVVGGKITNVREVCPNLYGDIDAPQSADIMLPNYTAKDSLTFSAAIRFLKDLFGINVDVDKVEKERSIEVKWQNIRETSYSDMDKWLQNGTLRPIPLQCRRAIETLQGRRAFENHVFVIIRAVAPESLKYDFSAAANAEGSASAELLKDSQARVQAKIGSIEGTQLEIRQRLYVGYALPVRLTEWIDSGKSSGELFVVKGVSTNLEIGGD